jgi:transposase
LLWIERGGKKREKVVIPEGIYLEPLPPYSPELQPAERLWTLADEPLVNEHFDSLEQLEQARS